MNNEKTMHMPFRQRYGKVSGEANEKQSFSDLTIPNRILAYGKIAKGEWRGKRKAKFFRRVRILDAWAVRPYLYNPNSSLILEWIFSWFCSLFRPSTVPQKNSEPFNNLIINTIKARALIAAAAT